MIHLARRLLSFESAHGPQPGTSLDQAARVCQALRVSLSKFAGIDGFRSLLSRALTLAQADAPSLGPVKVRPDGSLEGLGDVRQGPHAADADAGVLLVAHLLQLLTTFVGTPLTMVLLRDTWPDAQPYRPDPSPKEQS